MKTNYKFKDLPIAARRHVRIYQFQQFLSWGGFGITIVVLVLLLQERGFNLFDIAIITATYSGTALLFELPLGGLADGIGRKPVYILGVFADIAGLLTLLYFRSFEAAVASYAFYGFGRALSSGSLDAWYIETFHKLAPKFGTVLILAKVQFGGAIGLAIGAIFGGLIADFFGSYMHTIGYGKYDAPLIANFIVSIFMLFYTILVIKEDGRPFNRQAIKNGFANVPIILRDSLKYGLGHQIVLVLLVSVGFSSLAFFVLETFWIPFAKPMIGSQYAVSIIGIITSIYFFSIAIGVSFSTPLVALFKGQNIRALIFIVVLSGMFFIGLSFATNIYIFSLVLFALNAAKGASGAPRDSLFHAYVPNNKRSTLLSLQSLVMQVGGLVGMLGLGFVAEKYSIATAWQFGGSITIISGLVLLVLPKRMENTPVVGRDDAD
ncbi:MAG: MFS transporter [Alphaproteobacteria bacterium]|nr:MFS transporter [Alphaproteobacteria bacterium]